MTEEEKQLFRDLCTRIPYKVMGHATWTYQEPNGEIKHAEKDRPIEINDLYDIWNFKPYLRPMSSMTEEENDYSLHHGANLEYIGVKDMDEYITWLNAHHFDYRGLIEKGLAIKADDGIYN